MESSVGLIRHSDRRVAEPYPGVTRQEIVNRETGAGAISLSYLTIAPGAAVRVHHHKVEEAMLIVAGEGLGVLGDERFPVKANETVLAPAGVKHGFINTGSVPMIVTGNFPAVDIEIIFDE